MFHYNRHDCELRVNADVIKMSLLYVLNIRMFKAYHGFKDYARSVVEENIHPLSYFSK